MASIWRRWRLSRVMPLHSIFIQLRQFLLALCLLFFFSFYSTISHITVYSQCLCTRRIRCVYFFLFLSQFFRVKSSPLDTSVKTFTLWKLLCWLTRARWREKRRVNKVAKSNGKRMRNNKHNDCLIDNDSDFFFCMFFFFWHLQNV